MKAFLFPHALLLPAPLYRAALHKEELVARACLEKWLSQVEDPEQLGFLQHKLIGLVMDRFPGAFRDHAHVGVFENIARQARLRAHVAASELITTLQHQDWPAVNVVALGETYERFALVTDLSSHLETLELAVAELDFDQTVQAFQAQGFVTVSLPRQARGRGIRITSLRATHLNLTVRLLGMTILPTPLNSHEKSVRLMMMSQEAYRTFMKSRQASLLRRRDQILFDWYHLSLHGVDIAAFSKKTTSRWFRWQAAQIMGF